MTRPSPQLDRRGRAQHVAMGALLLGATGIGFSPIFVRLSELGPTATALWRPALALPVLWIWMALDKGGPRHQLTTRPDYRGIILAGLFFAGDLGFWHWSIRLTSVANATLLANFAPIFVTLGGWICFGQKVGPLFIGAMATALAGTALIVGSSFSFGPQHATGDGLGLVTAGFFAAYILAVKQSRNYFSAAAIMTWSSAVTALALLPVAYLSGENLIPATSYGWLILLGLALISHAAGQGLIAHALAHLPAAFSSVTLLWEPVMAALFAWLILSERLGWLQFLGGALTLVGILIARSDQLVARER